MKDSIYLAFEKLVKVYKSCTTTKQFVSANRYRSLFWSMYMLNLIRPNHKEANIQLFNHIRDAVDDTMLETLKNLSALRQKTT